MHVVGKWMKGFLEYGAPQLDLQGVTDTLLDL